jgi:hypothetical protein
MTLAVGTALQNGTYVLDAWIADDALGPVYLAMHVPTGQWVQLRVLGSRSPETLPTASDRQAFYHYLEQVNGLENPAFPTGLGGFEEEGVCYQILACPAGTSLDRLVTPQTLLPPRLSLGIVRQLLAALDTLRPLGWAGLRLTPDQVWLVPGPQAPDPLAPDSSQVILTGFDLAAPLHSPIAPLDASQIAGQVAPDEAALVRALSNLLYFLLTGQRAETTHAPLAVDVRRRHPSLPPSLDKVLELGSPQTQPWPSLGLTEWGALLPAIADLPLAAPAPAPAPSVPESAATRFVPPVPSPGLPTQAIADPARSSGTLVTHGIPGSQPEARAMAPLRSYKSRSTPAAALVITGLVATFSGLGFGLYARLHPASSASQERLNPNQSFPPLPDWNEDDLWQPWDQAPALRSRPDYGNTPPSGSNQPTVDVTPAAQEPAAPPPAVTQPELTPPESTPDAPEGWDPSLEPWPQPDSDLAPAVPETPAPAPLPEPIPESSPQAPPAPLEAPPPSNPAEGAAPPPLNAPPRPVAPAPSTS